MTARSLKFKPYARLLTMLGDQLIRNEQVALSELIKNAYDADATWVKVTFENFDEDFRAKDNAKIIVEDDGHGMTADVIENHWVNPATPLKLMGKKSDKKRTKSGRIIQGEKGIGRFALLKLGRDIRMITRPTGSSSENVLELALSKYDADFIRDDQAMFLDELELQFNVVAPAITIVEKEIDLGGREKMRRPHGTRIEISPPVGTWSRGKIEKVYEDLSRLQSIFGTAEDDDAKKLTDNNDSTDEDFAVLIYRDEVYEPLGSSLRDRLDVLLKDHSVFKIEGRYDEPSQTFNFEIDNRQQALKLTDAEVTGLAVFREYLKRHGLKAAEASKVQTECGSFGFSFYVFDFSNDAKGKFQLDKDDKDLIKNHRIYLYRDGIRVYPYGDPDDDWLLIDVRRGTVRASEFLSNDQVVGFVNISQLENPNLRDKTSREGLVDTGQAVDDFRSLLQTFLAWVRKGPYNNYKQRTKQSEDVDVFRTGKVQSLMDAAVAAAAAANVPTVEEKISEASKQYKAERRYLVQRAENTEHLAGVGLSVEAASHDLMLAMQRVMAAIDKLVSHCDSDAPIDKDALRAELLAMRGLLSFIQSQMSDMQLLFRSTKQRRKDIRVIDLVEKVAKIFKSLLDRNSIDVRVVETVGSPLVAKTTDAVLLQLLLNLFDNAAYWLQGVSKPRDIEILLDGDAGTMIFADSGPGFREEDLPYLFEPFFSGKGEDGRGLGLYIARQLLERHEYSIDIASKDQRILKGANLVVSFVKEQG